MTTFVGETPPCPDGYVQRHTLEEIGPSGDQLASPAALEQAIAKTD
jgi:hypothetical protein